jgi:hypothetical protein
MTIGIGLLPFDGVVVSADSQLTVPGYLKLDQGKVSVILRREPPPEPSGGSLVVAGAGTETSIQYVRQHLHSWFNAQPAVPEPKDVGLELERQIEEFHSRHVTPHGRGGELDVWMLVGALNGKKKSLWTTDKSILLEESMFAAVGSGAIYARSLLSKFFAPMNTIGAMLLASYVIYEVKQLIDGCGNYTDVIGLREDRFLMIQRSTAKELEDLFRRYSRSVTCGSLHDLFGRRIGWDTKTPIDISSELVELKKELEQIVESIENDGHPSKPTSS